MQLCDKMRILSNIVRTLTNLSQTFFYILSLRPMCSRSDEERISRRDEVWLDAYIRDVEVG